MSRYISNLFVKALLAAFIFIVTLTAAASADVSPGDRIDKTNWQKVESLLPESMVNYVKKGDFILDIGELKVDPAEFNSPALKQLLKTNVGKYTLSDRGEIVDAKTGKMVAVEGLPFPEIDPADPKAGMKILYNNTYEHLVQGNVDFSTKFFWVTRSGVERTVRGRFIDYVYTAFPSTKNIPNPNGYEWQNIILITEPYDVQGTAVMLWRYLDDRRDNNYSYVPAIRRVRRMTPASRSDAFLGSDFALDDTGGYDGKVPDFDWKLLRVQDALIPYVSKEPQELVPDPDSGGVMLSKSAPYIKYGFEKKGWTGAPWAPTNAVWVNRKAYVVEGTPKDPYYNYGKNILWFDVTKCAATFKINFDRANIYWKTSISPLTLAATKDRKDVYVAWGGLVMVDDRTDHATISSQMEPSTQWKFRVKNLGQDDFSLGGFQKYCK